MVERERERGLTPFLMKTKNKVGEGNQITSLFRRYHNIILVTVSKPTSKGIISYNCYLNLHSCLKRKEKKIREEGYLVLGSQLSTCVRLSL